VGQAWTTEARRRWFEKNPKPTPGPPDEWGYPIARWRVDFHGKIRSINLRMRTGGRPILRIGKLHICVRNVLKMRRIKNCD
jgi:hypothetical protein